MKHEQEACPKCGYCPHCGRSNQQQFIPYPIYPVYPYGTYPGWRYPYATWTVNDNSTQVGVVCTGMPITSGAVQ